MHSLRNTSTGSIFGKHQTSTKSAGSFLRAGVKLPALPKALQQYFSWPAANTAKIPLGFEPFAYGSTPIAESSLMLDGIEKDYIAAYVPTGPEAGQLRDAGANNFTVRAWLEQAALAVERNGGLGNSEDGFLAWGRRGFLRLRNPRLSPEQNRRLAAMSLQLGVEIENLPARSNESSAENASIEGWVERLLTKYDNALLQFKKDPSRGISLKDGRRRFGLHFHKELQLASSYYYKKRSGFKGIGRKALAIGGRAVQLISPTSLLPASLGGRFFQKAVSKNIPGLNSLTAQLEAVFNKAEISALISFIDPLRYTGELIEVYGRGKATLEMVIQAGLARAQQGFDMMPGVDPFSSAIKAVGMIATRLLQNSSIKAYDIVKALSGFLPGIPGLENSQQGVQMAVNAGAKGINRETG